MIYLFSANMFLNFTRHFDLLYYILIKFNIFYLNNIISRNYWTLTNLYLSWFDLFKR